MAIQKIQAVIGYQLMTIMVSTIKAHHLDGGSLPLTATAVATPSWMCSVGGGRFEGSYVGYSSYAVRPLVCILTSVFNSKYATSTTLVDK